MELTAFRPPPWWMHQLLGGEHQLLAKCALVIVVSAVAASADDVSGADWIGRELELENRLRGMIPPPVSVFCFFR
jgi:hypothetical protein